MTHKSIVTSALSYDNRKIIARYLVSRVGGRYLDGDVDVVVGDAEVDVAERAATDALYQTGLVVTVTHLPQQRPNQSINQFICW